MIKLQKATLYVLTNLFKYIDFIINKLVIGNQIMITL